jgi:di/tricarboxylate transporter
MSTDAVLTLIILAITLILLLSNIIRPDLVALLVLSVLGVTYIIPPSEIFTGFSRSAVITIMAVFILTNGLYRTGVTYWMGDRLLNLAGRRLLRMTFVVMLAGALLSGFMNTVAAGAVLLPAVTSLSRQTGVRPSKLLIPLAFGALMGGMATPLTTANILINSGLRTAGQPPFAALDFLPAGGLVALAGILFMTLIGRRWLPERAPTDRYAWVEQNHSALSDLYSLNEHVFEARIGHGSPLRGESIATSRIGETFGLNVLALVRNGRTLLAPASDTSLRADDVLVVVGRGERVQQLADLDVKIDLDMGWESDLSSGAVSLVEVVIAPRSRVVGQTLKQINFRQKFRLTVVALWRNGESHRTDVGDMTLQFGDALLLYGQRTAIRLLQAEPDFIVLQAAPAPQNPRKAIVAAAILLASLTIAALGWLPIAEATFLGAILMILTRCLTMDEAYQAIEWKAIFLIAGMLPLGIALQETGAAMYLGQALLQALGTSGVLVALSGVYLMAVLFTQLVSGQISAVIVTPIALQAAAYFGVHPYSFTMAVALACSTAFLTPVAHPINLLIMGPGGYSARDFLKVGLPLTALCFTTAMGILPIIWPL